MGFHIPDSPPRRRVTSAASQTTTTTTTSTSTGTSTSTDVDAAQFSERFSMRRRNAIIPSLVIDVVGSPRSPYVCLSRDHRLALSHEHERAQQTTEREAMSRAAVSAEDRDISMSSVSKRAPGIRRHVEQRDVSTEAHFGMRAALNVSDVP